MTAQPMSGDSAAVAAPPSAVKRSSFYAALRILPATVNGAPGYVLRRGDAVHSVLGFAAADGRLTAVYVVRNPDKLARIDRQLVRLH